jgi:polyhydroxyalkanoate synthase
MMWQGSRLALPLSKHGLLPWSPSLGPRAAALASDLADADLPALAVALEAELGHRADRFAAGIEAYRSHPYRRDLTEKPVLWAEGTTRLLDYGAAGDRPVLVVPSLINRADVLDLMPGRSMLRALAELGLRPLLVDWGEPGEAESRFDLTAYIAGRLEMALDAALTEVGGPVAVMGYCMGGLLAVALGLRRARDIDRLALLATPWDFRAGEAGSYADLLAAMAGPIAAMCAPLGAVPADILQGLFALADPALAIRKYSRFAEIDPASPEAIRFVATEDWLNDGVSLALPVAIECLAGWYGENRPEAGIWAVAGRTVEPARLAIPCLVVEPARDRLVPPASSAALARRLGQVEILRPDLGHIGIIIGGTAPEEVWTPVARFLLGSQNRNEIPI